MSAHQPAPATLDHAGIAARIPHSGRMCLLQALQRWDADHLQCSATSHQDPANPLCVQGVLWSACAIEYASQAMALHGVLSAAEGSAPRAGFLASVRAVQLPVARLDTVPGVLHIAVHRLAGDARQASYHFTLHSEAGTLLAEGRAAVVLDALP